MRKEAWIWRDETSKSGLLALLSASCNRALLAFSGVVYPVLADRKIDRKTSRQPFNFNENDRSLGEKLSAGATSVDISGEVMPVEIIAIEPGGGDSCRFRHHLEIDRAPFFEQLS